MDKRPTIAIVAHDVGGTGGMERHLAELIVRLRADADVIVVATTLNLRDTSGIRFIRIPVPKRPAPLKYIIFAVLASIRIWFLQFDILHTTGAIVWNRADVSTVHMCHAGYMEATGGARSKYAPSILRRTNQWISTALALWMERFIFKPSRTRQLVAVSNRVKKEILNNFPYAPFDIRTIPNGVDIGRFVPADQPEKRKLRREKDFPEDGIYMLFMGGDWPLKGLEFAIRTFDNIAHRMSSLHLIVVGQGDGGYYANFVDNGVRERLHFVGQQSDPHKWFGLSDVFIFPSSYETFSLVVHEAAACGLLIFSTQVGGVEDLIQDGVSGFFIDRDAETITSRIYPVMSALDNYQHVGLQARMAVQRLTWDRMYTTLHDLYHTILASKRPNQGRWQYVSVRADEKDYRNTP